MFVSQATNTNTRLLPKHLRLFYFGLLGELCESLAHREEVEAKRYEEEAPDVAELKAEQRQLHSLLEVLRRSKPDKAKH